MTHDADADLVQQIQQLNDELQQVRQRLMQAEDDAQAGLRARERFLTGMNRQFRTPMNAIMGFTQLMRHSTPTPLQARHLDIIAEAAAQMMSLFEGLMDMASHEPASHTAPQRSRTPCKPNGQAHRSDMRATAQPQDKR